MNDVWRMKNEVCYDALYVIRHTLFVIPRLKGAF